MRLGSCTSSRSTVPRRAVSTPKAEGLEQARATMDTLASTQVDGPKADDGELVESCCEHYVCRVWSREDTCMMRSGEVLREYSEADHRLWWAVLPAQDGGESHKVVACEGQYAEEAGARLWDEFLDWKAVSRSAGREV